MISLKYLSLSILVVQITVSTLVMRSSKLVEQPYFSSTAILIAEISQYSTLILIFYPDSYADQNSNKEFFMVVRTQIFGLNWNSAQIIIPAILYNIQNNLLFNALSMLDAATYQATYQLKILTTALCSVLILHKQVGWKQWASLLVLVSGVVLIQLSLSSESSASEGNTQKQLTGLLCIIGASCTSGISGVFFEKILKTSNVSLWARNTQLCLFSIPPAICSVLFLNYHDILEKGFFFGYTPLVWWVIFLQASSGIVVSIVMKYADNILKGFASSISIIFCSIFSFIYYQFHPSSQWIVGAMLVIVAAVMYSSNQPAKIKAV